MNNLKHYKGIFRLFLLLVAGPLLVCRLSCNRTANLWLEYHKTSETIRNLSREAEHLQKRDTAPQTGRIFSGSSISTDNPAADVLFPLTREHGCLVKDYVPTATDARGNLSLVTSRLVIGGTFSALVNLTGQIEDDYPAFKILSAHFHTVAPLRREDKKQLKLTLLIQYITDENQ